MVVKAIKISQKMQKQKLIEYRKIYYEMRKNKVSVNKVSVPSYNSKNGVILE